MTSRQVLFLGHSRKSAQDFGRAPKPVPRKRKALPQKKRSPKKRRQRSVPMVTKGNDIGRQGKRGKRPIRRDRRPHSPELFFRRVKKSILQRGRPKRMRGQVRAKQEEHRGSLSSSGR